MDPKPEPTSALRQWLRYALYPMVALVLAVLPLFVQILDSSASDSVIQVVRTYFVAGPILAVGLLVFAAYRFRDRHGAGDGYFGGSPGLTVALVGAACFVVATSLVTVAPERLGSWVVALVLDIAGVLALGAAMLIATRGRRQPGSVTDAGDNMIPAPLGPDPVLGQLEQEVSRSAHQWRRASRRWGATNYVLGFLTAALSGAAGVSGVSGDPTVTESIFAIFAIVGAGLAALTTSLGAAEAHKQSKIKAVALESLSREIRWRPIVQAGPPLETYINRFNEVTGPNWPSTGREPAAGPTL